MTITLTDKYTDVNKARAIPGAIYSKDHKAWVLDNPTPRGAAVALRLFPALAATHPELSDLRASLSQEVRPFDKATEFNAPISAPRVREVLAQEDHSLYTYQELDLGYLSAIMQTHGSGYNGWERGLGKTIGSCALIDELDAKRVLVVCPNTAKRSVWEPEVDRYCPWVTTVVLRNSSRHRAQDLAYVRQLADAGYPFVLIAHYEALAIIAGADGKGEQGRTGSADGWRKLKLDFDLVIADEVHRISNPRTQMAKALKKIPTKYKLALSGSIIQNHAEELYSPLQWLFPQHYKSKWRDWNDRYLDYVDNGFSKVCVGVKIDQLDAMREELGVFMVVRTKEDELDLPARTEQTLYVDLSPAQAKAYKDLRETCMAELENGSVIKALDGLSLLTRLRQVATGLDLVGGAIGDSTKVDLAVDLIEDAPDEAFVVFSWYKAAATELQRRLEDRGIGTFLATGDVPQNKRADYIAQFQEGYGRVFIGTIKTLSESVTLHRASNAIFLDRSFNPGDNAQAADRIYRIGQKKPVTITQIVARGTVDELVVTPITTSKEALRAAILGV